MTVDPRPAGGLDVQDVQEAVEGLATAGAIREGLGAGTLLALRGTARTVVVGEGALVKVTTNIGCSDPRLVDVEFEKADRISGVGYRPDLMMDLSIVRPPRPVYRHLVERFGGPVGTLPHYLCYKPRKGIDAALLLEEIERQAAAGVAWMTLHLAVTRELYETARRTRLTPVTARGGGLVVEDLYLHDRRDNIMSELFPEILAILRRHGTALSLGTTFRPSNVVDALDQVHVGELELQGRYIEEARRQGVGVMLEAVGHMGLAEAAAFTDIVRRKLGYNLPVMTLGPIPTDAAVGEDHIANAVGGAYLAMLGGTNVLNSVTREEHTGRVPNVDSVMEGLRAARIAAHSVNMAKFQLDVAVERDVVSKRAANYTCVVEGGMFTESARTRFSMGCARCGNECPLIINFQLGSDGRPVRTSG
jgi:phosphomethylpyrimidine synthase